MSQPFDAMRTARFIADAHRTGAAYENLAGDLAPTTVAEAYAAQEALCELWRPTLGPVVGLKIATTTKVMQQLMGIDHPCGGMIYEHRVHRSPADLRLGDFVHLMIECELAVRLARDLPGVAGGHTRASARAAIAEVMPAFELIEDRHAEYKTTRALSVIADNTWNGGIVLGAPTPIATGLELDGVAGRLTVNGREHASGLTDDPLGALAWVATLAAERGRPLTAGMVVITGSVIATLPIAAGDRMVFSLAGLGTTEITAA